MVPSSMRLPGAPLTCTTPLTISRSSGVVSRASAAIRSTFSRVLRAARAMAEPLMTAAREAKVPTEYGDRRVSPVTTSTSSKGTPSSSATIWAKAVWWPCPWLVRPVDTFTLPDVSTCTWPPS